MARKFTESFDMGSLDQYTSVSTTSIVSSSIGGGDFAMTSGGSQEKVYASGEDEQFYGFYISPQAPGVDVNEAPIRWRNGTTVLGRLGFNASKQLVAYTGLSTLVGSDTYVWSNNETRHIQVRVKIHDTTGVIQVKIDDILVIDFLGDTKPGAETVIDGFQHVQAALFASVVNNNTSGTKDNGWPGVLRMRGRKPDEDGFYNDFDREPASPTTAFDKVDDSGTTPDTADFVSTDVNLEAQSLRFPSHGLIRADVKAVNYLYYMRKIASGQATHGTRKIATEANIFDAAPINLSTSFRTERFRYTENPHTALPWVLEDAQDDRFESIIQSLV